MSSQLEVLVLSSDKTISLHGNERHSRARRIISSRITTIPCEQHGSRSQYPVQATMQYHAQRLASCHPVIDDILQPRGLRTDEVWIMCTEAFRSGISKWWVLVYAKVSRLRHSDFSRPLLNHIITGDYYRTKHSAETDLRSCRGPFWASRSCRRPFRAPREKEKIRAQIESAYRTTQPVMGGGGSPILPPAWLLSWYSICDN